MREKQKGITLIALVITIIVLLILAGVSIATLTGQNGVLTQANNAKIAQAHGNVKDSMALAYNEYQLEKQTQNVGEIEKVASTSKIEIKGKEKNYLARLDTFLDFLLDKGYIESKETGKIIVDKLTGAHQEIGNGKGETDIYKIEGTEGTYKVKYYNNQGTEEEIWTVTGNESKPQGNTKSIKMIVNSGEDGLVLLPILKGDVSIENKKITINWGDGKIETIPNENAEVIIEQKEIANVNERIQIAAIDTNMLTIGMHNYEQKNVEYEIEIDGNIKAIDINATDEYLNYGTGEVIDYPNGKDKILEITQWGETGLEYIFFEDCTNLRKIASPSKNSFINIDPEYGFDSSFIRCKSLAEIPSDLFSNCPQVTHFIGTFNGCDSLIEIPDNLFSNCSNIEDMHYSFAYCDNLKRIGNYAFANCSKITSLESLFEQSISNLETIGDYAFANCTGLTSIKSPVRYTNIKELGEGAFANCTGITSFERCFSECKKLEKVGDNAFAGCSNVTTFEQCFKGCYSLKTIGSDLFKGCDKVNNYCETFSKCSSLTGVAPELWKLGTNTAENQYMGNPDGAACFGGCELLENYSIIPEYWAFIMDE